MKLQILKLAKRLNHFSLSDIQTMTELDENKTLSILNSLIIDGLLKQKNDEYFFIGSKQVKEVANYKGFNEINLPEPTFKIEDLTNNSEEINLYNQLSKQAKEKVYKDLFLIKCVGDLGGAALAHYLIQFERKHPDFKMAYSTFHKRRKAYLEKGLKGLIPNVSGNANQTVITQEQYDMFKMLYLSSEALTAVQCVKRMEELGLFENELIPEAITFERQIQKEFTKTNILNFRKNNKIGSQILDTLSKASNEKYENFIDGANAFLNSDYLKSLAQEKAISAGIKNHLIPYFKDYKFKDISKDVLRVFKKEKISSGLSPASLSRIIIYLKYIVEGYSADKIQILSYKKAEVATGLKTKYELITTLNKVKNTKLYLPVLLVLSLGLKLAEVEALDWEDIDLINKEIIIDKVLVNGVAMRYRKNHQKRICKIPNYLYKVLKIEKAKAMRMFGEITNSQLQTTTQETNLSFDVLRDSYVKDLIDHQIPINLISKRLGFCHTNEFLEHYESLIDETLIDDYDPLAI